MMMLKMMNPFGSVTDSIPGVGGGGDSEDSGVSKEEAEEQERFVIFELKNDNKLLTNFNF